MPKGPVLLQVIKYVNAEIMKMEYGLYGQRQYWESVYLNNR